MGSLLSKIADEHRDFENWCMIMGYDFPDREYWKHPKYQEYEDYLDPPAEREKRKQDLLDRMNAQIPKVGILKLENWFNADLSKTKCPVCKTNMLRKWGWILSDEFGCPKCGHEEGGDW